MPRFSKKCGHLRCRRCSTSRPTHETVLFIILRLSRAAIMWLARINDVIRILFRNFRPRWLMRLGRCVCERWEETFRRFVASSSRILSSFFLKFPVILKLANFVGAKLFLLKLTFSSLFYNSFTNSALAMDTGIQGEGSFCPEAWCFVYFFMSGIALPVRN